MICKTCGEKYDESKVSHVPVETSQPRGSMTIRFVTGCKEIPVEKDKAKD